MQEAQDRIKELMKPRYKVIADFPESCLEVGEVLIVGEGSDFFEPLEWWDKYPHLFKKLEWWQERDGFADFPKYVKLVLNDRIQFIHKVQEWKGYNSHGQPLYDFVNKANYLSPFCVSGLTPATEQDYNDFINQQKR